MGDITLHGWDATNGHWRRLSVNSDGKIIIDPLAIFENPPTEDEAKKGPSSEWAFDHAADVAVHHAKYTDAESRAAIGDLFNATGFLTKNMDCNVFELRFLKKFMLVQAGDSKNRIYFEKTAGELGFRVIAWNNVAGYSACSFAVYDGADYQLVATESVVDDKITDHAADDDAHHAKYTDAEALAACGLDGNQYWSCPGIHFDGEHPDTDDLIKSVNGSITTCLDNLFLIARVDLPHGATVTSVIVMGDEGAEGVTWRLRRSKVSDLTLSDMALEDINTADTSINNPVIDNSAYSYYIYTGDMEAGDIVYGALITYTI